MWLAFGSMIRAWVILVLTSESTRSPVESGYWSAVGSVNAFGCAPQPIDRGAAAAHLASYGYRHHLLWGLRLPAQGHESRGQAGEDDRRQADAEQGQRWRVRRVRRRRADLLEAQHRPFPGRGPAHPADR